ncbi:hypothetical protein AERO9AM_70320 [Aeromicrobium sp. 9AM]|nr:hypothetical protein AERO9AM_70320 [Aeromicrobium sp. 9AM]
MLSQGQGPVDARTARLQAQLERGVGPISNRQRHSALRRFASHDLRSRTEATRRPDSELRIALSRPPGTGEGRNAHGRRPDCPKLGTRHGHRAVETLEEGHLAGGPGERRPQLAVAPTRGDSEHRVAPRADLRRGQGLERPGRHRDERLVVGCRHRDLVVVHLDALQTIDVLQRHDRTHDVSGQRSFARRLQHEVADMHLDTRPVAGDLVTVQGSLDALDAATQVICGDVIREPHGVRMIVERPIGHRLHGRDTRYVLQCVRQGPGLPPRATPDPSGGDQQHDAYHPCADHPASRHHVISPCDRPE